MKTYYIIKPNIISLFI